MARRWGVLALVAISCHNRPTPAPAPGWVSATGQAARPTTPLTSARTEVALAPTTEEADGHIEIKLGTTPPMLAPVPATDLSASETSTLLASLPALPPVTAGPALRPPSAAPPKGGTAATPLVLASPRGAQIPDVPATQPPAAPIAPMDPPEIQPTGEVDSDAEVTVRFAQSMLAVGAIDTRAAPPISIAPAVAGTWRWVDTRVAKFVPKASFAPATKYTVSVPAGIKAASGAALTAVTTATFSTPTLGLDSHYHQTLGPASPTVIWFDQPVDAANIGAFVRVEHRNTKAAVPFDVIAIDVAKQRWATEPRTDPAWLRRFEASDKLIIIAPRTTWPSGAGLRVVLAKGAPSAAGPLTTTTEQSFELDVAPTFTLTGISCGTPDTMPDDGTAKLTGQVCPAGGLIDVEFSNEILVTGYRPEQIQIADTPRYENKAGYRYVQLLVPGDVGKKLTVKVARDLVDEYGQTLTGPNEATFTTKKPTPDVVFEAHGGLVVLDPGLDIPMWSVKAQSIAKMRVELYAVQPADYFEYERFETGKRRTPPGKRVFDKSFDVGRTNAARVRVDLRPALAKSGTGHVIAVATPTGYGKLESWQRQIPAWIQVTHLGLSARFDDEKIFPYVNRLAIGKYNEPVAGVATSLLVDGEGETQAAAPTTAEGLAAIELPAPRKRKRSPHALVIARAGDDVAFSAIDAFERSVRTNKARWYVTDDRFTYKPGETVYIKGWVRWTHNGTNPGLALPRQGDTVAYTLTDPRDVKLAHGTAVLGAQGGFDFEVKLPKNANLGQSRFELTTGGESMSHYIAIEEFRTPAFEVTLNDDVGFGGRVPVIVGEAIEMTASARYYGGGGLGGARVRWAAMLRAASYRPPGWSDFSFGDHSRSYRPRAAATSNASLSSASTSTASIAISELPERRPSLLTVDASVTDVDRITLRDVSREILVHPSAFYVGVRHRSATELELVVTDIDGHATAGVPIEVTIEATNEVVSEDAVLENTPKDLDRQSCRLTSASTPVVCTYNAKHADWPYHAIARVVDARGRANTTDFFIPWWYVPPDDEPSLRIVAPDKLYRPGDIAKLEVRSDVVPAAAIVSYSRQGVFAQRRVVLDKPSTIIEVPIEATYMRDVHVIVDRVSSSKLEREYPEQRHAETRLELDPDFARLSVTARAQPRLLEPGGKATFDVAVEHTGKPVAGAEVALIVVDEAVLAVSEQSHDDPLDNFYFEVDEPSEAVSMLDHVWLSDDRGQQPGFERWSIVDGVHAGFGVGGGRGGMRGRTAAVPSVRIGQAAATKVRKDFRPTAVFSPHMITDSTGHAQVSVTMPDSLTRYRVVALATANTVLFGKGESTVATQRPINARVVAPRFLSLGDAFSLPVIVQNLDSRPRTFEVAVRATNLSGGGGRRVTVPAGQRAELQFPFAAKARGTATIQAIARSEKDADAVETSIPIYEPVTTESFATYGTFDDDKPHQERLVVPSGIVRDLGGLEAELSASQVLELVEAYDYLERYPFECAEQRSSRMLAELALDDVLDQLERPDRPSKAEREQRRKRDIAALAREQHSDGGWGYFAGTESDEFVSQQVLAALVAAKANTASVVDGREMVDRAFRARLQALEDTKPPATDSADSVALAAAELATLAGLLTDKDRDALALRLHAAAKASGAYPLDARALLLAVVANRPTAAAMRKELLAALLGAVREEAAAAIVTEGSRGGAVLGSPTKTAALVLDALVREAPQHAVIPKLVRGLLDARKSGRWSTTQENAAVLVAVRRYIATYEKTTPAFTAKLWAGSAGYAEQAFEKRESRATLDVPWTALAGAAHDIVVTRDGTGRLYYRLGVTYAPLRVDQALDAGFVVRKSYRTLDGKEIPRRADGSYHVALGTTVRLDLEVITTARRHAVALADPLPAGFEVERGKDAETIDAGWDHVNLRDDRGEAFAMELAAGTHHFSYVVRAITPGTFNAAPPKAEEMYAPETFGRGTSATVVIE